MLIPSCRFHMDSKNVYTIFKKGFSLWESIASWAALRDMVMVLRYPASLSLSHISLPFSVKGLQPYMKNALYKMLICIYI